MSTQWFDRAGNRLSADQYRALKADSTYSIVRQFDDDKLRICLFWDGKVVNAQNYAPSYRPLFRITCSNRKLSWDGELQGWAKDPVMDGTTYATEAEAVLAYEAFLERWTASGYEVDAKTGNKVFNEAGNKLTPPPPPDPDAPSITDLGDKDCDDVGAW